MRPASRLVVPADEAEPPLDPGGTPEPSEHLDDSQVLGFSEAIDTVEIEHAKLAVVKSRDERVKRFASMMIADHGQALKQRAELAERLSLKPDDSRTATKFRVEATKDQNELSDDNGPNFDKRYLESQIELHERIVRAYDEELVAHTAEPDLKLLLQRFRARIADHRDQARALLDEID